MVDKNIRIGSGSLDRGDRSTEEEEVVCHVVGLQVDVVGRCRVDGRCFSAGQGDAGTIRVVAVGDDLRSRERSAGVRNSRLLRCGVNAGELTARGTRTGTDRFDLLFRGRWNFACNLQ